MPGPVFGYIPPPTATKIGGVRQGDDTTPIDANGVLVAKQPIAAQGAQFAVRRMIDIATNADNLTAVGTDDAIGDTGHVLLDLSAALLSLIHGSGISYNFYLDTSWKALTLWNGSGSNAPPSNWNQVGFDDSAWPLGVVETHDDGLYTPVPGGHAIWPESSGLGVPEDALFRAVLALPGGTLTRATMVILCDDVLKGCWVGGTFVPGTVQGFQPFPIPAYGPFDITSLLTAGANNTFALWGSNTVDPTAAGMWFGLHLVYNGVGPPGSGGSTLPAGTEGDLVYFHNGLWIPRHIGPAFSVLQSNGADPVYGDVPMQWEKSGTLQAVRGIANLIPGTGVTLTVADNAGADRVDITIASSGAGTLELTDGTNDLTAVQKITTTHMDVGGTAPNATLKPQTATASSLGIVQPDDSTITVNGLGVISAVVAGALTVLTDHIYTADLANQAPIALDTWTGIGSAVSFTVPSGTGTVFIIVSGTILVTGTIASGASRRRVYSIGSRLNIDSGTSTILIGGTAVQIGGTWSNVLAGAGVVAGSFSAGSHTVQAQVAGRVSILASCMPASSPYHSLRITVLYAA